MKKRTWMRMPSCRHLLDVWLALCIFLGGCCIGQAYLAAARKGQTAVAGIELLYGPAVMMAYGYGFIYPDLQRYPELRAFLRNERESLPREALPTVIIEGESEVAEYHRYLLYATAAFWRVLGVSWRNLEPLLALMAGWCALAIYGLMRLGMKHLLAAVLALVVAASPGMLCIMPDLRDFSKAPFILTIMLLLGWLLKAKTSFVQASVMAAALGCLTGVGMGFRQDVLVFAPPAVLILVYVGLRMSGAAPWRRVLPALVFIACFLVTAWPMLTRMEGAAGPDHHIVQGFSRKHTGNLGVESPLYEHLASGMDNYVFASLYSYRHRTEGGPVDHFGYNSPGHEAASRAWLFDMGRHFPGDLLARGYGAALRMLQYSNAYPTVTLLDHPWIERVLPGHQAFARHMHVFGLVYALIVLLLIGGQSVFLALGLLVFALYACGYVSLQCEYRHAFHLTFVPFWLIGFLVSSLGRLLKFRDRVHREDLSWWNIAMRMGSVAALVPAMLLAPLGMLRWYQAPQVERLIDAYRTPSLVSVPVRRRDMFDWTLFSLWPVGAAEEMIARARYDTELQALWGCVVMAADRDRRSGHTRTRYLALVFDEMPAKTPLLVLYDSPVPWNDFTQVLEVGGGGSTGPATYFLPVYEMFMHDEGGNGRNHFRGVALPASLAHHLLEVREVRNVTDFRFLLHFTKSEDFETLPRHQVIALAHDRVSYYRAEAGAPATLQYAQAMLDLGRGEEARLLFQAALLATKSSAQRLIIVEILRGIGELDIALMALLDEVARHPQSGPDAANLLLNIGVAFQEQGQREKALTAFKEADRHVSGASYAKIVIGDFYAEHGDYDGAIACYADYLQHHPESDDIAGRIQNILHLGMEDEVGTELWRSILAQSPESTVARLQLAEAQLASGDVEGAAATLEAVLRQHPGHLDAKVGLVGLYPLLDRFEEGMALLEVILRDYPEHAAPLAESVLYAARALNARQQGVQAVELVRALLGRATLDGPVAIEMAIVLQDAGETGQACGMYRELIEAPDAGSRVASLLDRCYADATVAGERIRLWQKLVEAHPERRSLREHLAAAFFDVGRYDEARAVFESLGAAREVSSDFIPRLGTAKILAGEDEEGARLIETYLGERPEMIPEAASTMLQAIRLLQEQEDVDSALLLAREAVLLFPALEAVWLAWLEGLAPRETPDKVLAAMEPAFDTVAGPWELARRLDELVTAANTREFRREAWRNLWERYPDVPAVRHRLAMALEDAGDVEGALVFYEGLMDLVPEPARLRVRLGGALAKTGRIGEAMDQFSAALAREETLAYEVASACIRAAEAHAVKGRDEQAITLYERVQELNLLDAAGRIQLAELYARSGRIEEAMVALEQVVKQDLQSPPAIYAARQWDILLKQHGGLEARIEVWQAVTEAWPGAWLPAEYLVVALMEAHRLDEALQVCERAVDQAPQESPLHLAKAALLCRKGDLEKGFKGLETARAGGRDTPEIIVDILADAAIALLCQGRHPESEKLLLTAEILDPDNLWRQVRLGELYAAQGRYEDALARYRRVLTAVPDSPYTASRVDAVYKSMDDPQRRLQEWMDLAVDHPTSQIVQQHLVLAREDRYLDAEPLCE